MITALVLVWLTPRWLRREAVNAERQVVVYTSQDQVYAEPILRRFEQQSGVRVRAVYDSEAVKTVGLANRLLAERDRPQCDVFWSNEELRTRQLTARGVFRPRTPWVAVGYRSRRIVINTDKVPLAEAPRSLAELVEPRWRGKVALAYPLFGTTATHFLVLRQHWGEARWRDWAEALLANEARVVDGNSIVVRLVGLGESWIGLTDSDDIAAGQREGWPLAALPMTNETLLIPNTVGVIHRAPHPAEADLMAEFLQSAAVLRELVREQALEGVEMGSLESTTLRPDWDRLLGSLSPATEMLGRLFLR